VACDGVFFCCCIVHHVPPGRGLVLEAIHEGLGEGMHCLSLQL
jgi:hypothetical protein